MPNDVTPGATARGSGSVASVVDDTVLDQLFRSARSTHAFSSKPVTDETLQALYGLVKWGPTAFNAQPARYVFIRSPGAKARLAEALSSGNRAKTLAAPATCIVAYDTRFYERLPALSPGSSAVGLFRDNTSLAEATALRNSSLQGAYLLLAARALGLAVGPMSGFDPGRINKEFFADSTWAANFLVNLGYADGSEARPRGSRLEFADCVQVI
jgi:3-hydroxypropanoate dehydrogenase